MANNFKTANFDFLTINLHNPKHLSTLDYLADDPEIRKYFGNLRDYIEEIDFGPKDLSGDYLVSLDDNLVGFISLYDYFKYMSISYGLMPRYRGIKLVKNDTIAVSMVKEMSQSLFKKRLELEYLRAYINKNNIKSKKMALKSGFVLIKNNDSLIADEYRLYKHL